jgi:hypothetical protein
MSLQVVAEFPIYTAATPEVARQLQTRIRRTGATAILGAPATTRGPRWACYLHGERLPGDAPYSWSWATQTEAEAALIAAVRGALLDAGRGN